MKKISNYVLTSTQELKKTKTMTVVSMLIALMCVLNYVGSVYITPTLKVSFIYLPFLIIGMLYGPVIAGIAGGISDILNYITKPAGTFFPGFTLTAIITGIIYGVMLYKKKPTITRCVILQLIIMVFCDLILNTLWLTLLYGKGFFVLLPARALKELIMFVIKVPTMYLLTNIIYKIKDRII